MTHTAIIDCGHCSHLFRIVPVDVSAVGCPDCGTIIPIGNQSVSDNAALVEALRELVREVSALPWKPSSPGLDAARAALDEATR